MAEIFTGNRIWNAEAHSAVLHPSTNRIIKSSVRYFTPKILKKKKSFGGLNISGELGWNVLCNRLKHDHVFNLLRTLLKTETVLWIVAYPWQLVTWSRSGFRASALFAMSQNLRAFFLLLFQCHLLLFQCHLLICTWTENTNWSTSHHLNHSNRHRSIFTSSFSSFLYKAMINIKWLVSSGTKASSTDCAIRHYPTLIPSSLLHCAFLSLSVSLFCSRSPKVRNRPGGVESLRALFQEIREYQMYMIPEGRLSTE